MRGKKKRSVICIVLRTRPVKLGVVHLKKKSPSKLMGVSGELCDLAQLPGAPV